MKLYYWNLFALGLTLLSWLMIRLGYSVLPKSWETAIWYIGFLVYLVALAGLGWGAVRVIWGAMQSTLSWSQSLLVVGLTVIQGIATLFFFLVLMAEGFNQEK